MTLLTQAILAGLFLGCLILTSLPARAGTSDPGIQRRELNQQRRIYQGVDSGQLTPREFNRMENQEARIKATEARMKADGNLTPPERARLHRLLNKSSRNIYRLKHNARKGA